MRSSPCSAGAAALVFPIDWEEPFGMVMIEAMACGTPVLATRRGAVPEVVLDGETGFVRDDVDGLVVRRPPSSGRSTASAVARTSRRRSPSGRSSGRYERAIGRRARIRHDAQGDLTAGLRVRTPRSLDADATRGLARR